MCGLLESEKGKGNMERIEEQSRNVLPYHQYQHFLTNSPWSSELLQRKLSNDLSGLLEKEKEKTGKPTGLLLDESSHLKKGKSSVGVARQYAGIIGKVENCQVGVYSSLCNGSRASLLDERLFLPKEWIEDKQRRTEGGIPEEMTYKTKPELGLEMVKSAQENGVLFDWVGGDGLYGNNYELAVGLESLEVLFVLDIHKDQSIYTVEPIIFLPERKSSKGRPPSRYKTTEQAQRVDKYAQSLKATDWKEITIRKTTKGWLKAWIHCVSVWVWNKKEEKARQRTLVIQRVIREDNQITQVKYSLSNGTLEEYSVEEFAFFQAQRYWVERTFDDAKNELGLSDYQVRKWNAWHHHHAIVMLAMLFMLKEQIDKEKKYPLMSIADARKIVLKLIIETIYPSKSPIEMEIERMNKRHRKRKKSIDWHFKNDSS